MKVLLKEPIDGFEQEVEFRLPKNGEFYLLHHGDGPILATADSADYSQPRLVLKSKKKKYWRLDPVDTFEDASNAGPTGYRYGASEIGVYHYSDYAKDSKSIQWLRITEHSE